MVFGDMSDAANICHNEAKIVVFSEFAKDSSHYNKILHNFASMKVAIIGAGAAGCFCAVNLKRNNPDAVVEVFEAGARALAKVAIKEGGQ